MIFIILLAIAAYILGSIPTAVLVCRLLSLPDPRAQGSHNPGATNVLRIGNKKAAALTLLGDMLKGLIAVIIAKSLTNDPLILSTVALSVFLGHIHSLFLGFRGGKGVATFLGVLLGLYWPIGLLTSATWLATAWLFRISSLAALTAALATPLYTWLLTTNTTYTITMTLMAGLLFWRHRKNIKQLLAGTEGRLDSRS